MTPWNANLLAGLFLAAFVPFALFLDAVLPRHRAVLATMLLGVLFMPWASVDLGGLLDWNRRSAITIAVFLGMMLRDPDRLGRYRFHPIDLPILCYCVLFPVLTSVSNGLGIYDGLSGALKMSLWLAGPYFIGRLFFETPEQRRDLARAVLLGALIYVPFCAWEIRMSPQLHSMLYGFMQHEFQQSVRGSLYRPMVFMQHGLMVAMWIAGGCLFAWLLRVNRDPWRPFGLTLGLLGSGLLLVLVAMQSLGATILTLAFLGTIWFVRRSNARWPLLMLAIVPLIWTGARVSGLLDSQRLGDLISLFSPDRARSFASRLYTEDVLVSNTLQQRPLTGLGTWGADRTIMIDGREQYIVVDGFWVIAFSRYGFLGLAAFMLAHFLPAWRVLRRTRPSDWSRVPDHGVVAALAVVFTIVAIDNLMNAMFNPLFMAIAGALVTAPAEGEVEEEPEMEYAGLGHEGPFARVLGHS